MLTHQVSAFLSFNEFLSLVASELLVRDESLSDNTKFRNLPGWSSLNALLLISKLNEDYGVFISSADLAAINSLGDFYNLMVKRVNGN